MRRIPLFCLLTTLAATAGPGLAQQRPTVDLAVRHGKILHNANGFHGSIDKNVDLDRVVALKPAILRRYGNQTPAVAGKTGAEVVCLLPHYDQGQNWKTDWSGWERKVRSRVHEVTAAAKKHGFGYHYDVWNEPDNWKVPDYYEFWCRTAVLLRRLDPTARVAGPSFSHSGNMVEFLQYTDAWSKQNGKNARPDILNWHEFSDPMKIIDDAAGMRKWLKEHGMDKQVTRLSVNEFMMSPMPDVIPRMFAAAEIARIDWAGCGYGSRKPKQLNGLLAPDGQTPYGAWHLYRDYAEMAGQVVGIDHSQDVNVFATFDEKTGQIRVLLGTDKNRQDSVELVLKNLSKTGTFAPTGQARVQTARYKIWGGVDNEHTLTVDYAGDILRLPLNGLVEGKDLLPGTDKHGLSITITPVPEPASSSILLLGGAMLARRKARP